MKSIKRATIIVGVLSFFAVEAFATTAWISNEEITGIWVMPNRNKFFFKLSGGDTHSKLWVDADEKDTIAFILSAHANGTKVSVQWTDDNAYVPWTSWGTAYSISNIRTAAW